MKSDIRTFYTVKRLSMPYKVSTLRLLANCEVALQACGVSTSSSKSMADGSRYLEASRGRAEINVFIGTTV
jgi:hypothetical protein